MIDIHAHALEAFNRASHSDALPEMQIAPAEDLQADLAPSARLRPLVTSLWLAAALLVVAHVVWVGNGTPVPAFIGALL